MEATPDVYRADIARTHEAIANLERSPMTETDAILHARLVQQLANLEHGLAQAEAALSIPSATPTRCALCGAIFDATELFPLDDTFVCLPCRDDEEERYHRQAALWAAQGPDVGPYCDHDLPLERCIACHR